MHARLEQNFANFIVRSGPLPQLSPDIWTPPPPPTVKLNFDGSYNPVTEKAGIGGIVRNATGLLIVAYAGEVKASHSIEAEIQALISGIELCVRLGHLDVIREGDCLVLIESLAACQGLPYMFMENWRILLQKLKQLHTWQVRFCRRTSNQVADELSKLAPPLPAIFTGTLPPTIHDFYLEDMRRAAEDPTENRGRAASSTSYLSETSPQLCNFFPQHPKSHLLSKLNNLPQLRGHYSCPTELHW